jgi:hypothetical protein
MWEAEIRKIMVPGQFWEKKSLQDPNSMENKLGVVLYAWQPAMGETKNRRIVVQTCLSKK